MEDKKYTGLLFKMISNTISEEEVFSMFNEFGVYYIMEDDFIGLLSDMITSNVDMKYFTAILKAKKTSTFNNYKTKDGVPLVQKLLYEFSNNQYFNDIKDGLIELLESDDCKLRLDIKSINNEDILYTVCKLSKVFSKDDLLRLFNIIKKNNLFYPLNKTSNGDSAINIFVKNSNLKYEDTLELFNILNEENEIELIEDNNE